MQVPHTCGHIAPIFEVCLDSYWVLWLMAGFPCSNRQHRHQQKYSEFGRPSIFGQIWKIDSLWTPRQDCEYAQPCKDLRRPLALIGSAKIPHNQIQFYPYRRRFYFVCNELEPQCECVHYWKSCLDPGESSANSLQFCWYDHRIVWPFFAMLTHPAVSFWPDTICLSCNFKDLLPLEVFEH